MASRSCSTCSTCRDSGHPQKPLIKSCCGSRVGRIAGWPVGMPPHGSPDAALSGVHWHIALQDFDPSVVRSLDKGGRSTGRCSLRPCPGVRLRAAPSAGMTGRLCPYRRDPGKRSRTQPQRQMEPQPLGQLLAPAAVGQDPSRVVAQEQSPASPNHRRCGLAATMSPPRWLGRRTARVCRSPRPPSGMSSLTSH